MKALWVFGYGSLIWRPDFQVSEQRRARLDGWARRFWQASTDHRGTPQAPGRVVTLTAAPQAHCWGVAFRVADRVRDQVLARLDHREKGGYERHQLPLHTDEGTVQGLVYVASPHNPNYVGPASATAIAAQIAVSHGPSGANVEYLLELERALHELDAHCAHVSEIADALRALSDQPSST